MVRPDMIWADAHTMYQSRIHASSAARRTSGAVIRWTALRARIASGRRRAARAEFHRPYAAARAISERRSGERERARRRPRATIFGFFRRCGMTASQYGTRSHFTSSREQKKRAPAVGAPHNLLRSAALGAAAVFKFYFGRASAYCPMVRAMARSRSLGTLANASDVGVNWP